jgi:biliverdin reductase/flavin reductase
MNPDEIAPYLESHDCVLSALGVRGICIFKVTFYLDSMKSITAAMRKANLKRLICVTSFYSKRKNKIKIDLINFIRSNAFDLFFHKADTIYPQIYKFLLRPMIGRQLDSMNEMEEYLVSQCSDLDYTIVRPPRLQDEPLKGLLKNINVKILIEYLS